MKRLLVLLSLGLALGALAGTAYAQHYKWVDQNGRTQYGDHPPPGVKATPLRAPPGPAAPAASAAQNPGAKPATAAEKDADIKKRQADAAKEQEKQAAAAKDAEAKRANCALARANMETLEIGRVRRVNPKTGEYEYMEDAQLAEAKERTRKSIAEWCS
ncbi:MAG TPA: DUF4124 domain-containing protein [Burkholderiales bacterium]